MSRDHIRSTRFTAEEIERIEKAAKEAGMTVSAYLRRCAVAASYPSLEIALNDYQPTTVGAATSMTVYWRSA